MAKCKSCGAEIVWIRSVAGKMIPCDPVLVAYWERLGAKGRVVTHNGEVLACDFMDDPHDGPETCVGYVPHWATCPAADQHRRR